MDATKVVIAYYHEVNARIGVILWSANSSGGSSGNKTRRTEYTLQIYFSRGAAMGLQSRSSFYELLAFTIK
jgi:hypothetical protein